ncbi:chromosome condensation protein CrcB [Oceanidesulfovibrio indonesiensis]|uniref:Fluoride-specific ion channel FluC n=1 Tax=Oceanidesulfovibrio indonesiensis TaxID=54767 RepID=A0A7M3MGP0_9BACT|nr:CrcB family protein [Oceanidesulfovibrio indonesiensis]TVM18493.1 chromosome condensation protein CrcB [Oceanidesulfovibrio indonesiensis]
MQKLAFIALAGALGSLSRYGLAGLVHRFAGAGFPYGTFVVNIIGSFLFGLVWGFSEGRLGFSPELRIILLTGFMGAFTTFSTFAFESTSMLRTGQLLPFAANVGGQIIVGFTLLWLGLALGKAI